MASTALLGHPSVHTTHKFVVVTPWHYVQSLPQIFGRPEDPPPDEERHSAILPEVWREADEILAGEDGGEGEEEDGEDQGEDAANAPSSDDVLAMDFTETVPPLHPQLASSTGHIPLIERCHALFNEAALEEGFDHDVEEGCVMDTAHIESDEGTHVAAIPRAYNYACRGLSLRHLSVFEYAMLLVIEKGESKKNLRTLVFFCIRVTL